MNGKETRDTKDSLLDAAEALFDEHGVNATSLRAITERAGANVAAVNYHFGSKETLVLAVVERRVRPLNQERFRLLGVLEVEGRFTLEGVLYALIAPAVQGKGEMVPVLRFLGRLHFEADDKLRGQMLESFADVIERFVSAFGRCQPELSKSDILWRLHLSMGAMAMAVTNLADLTHLSSGQCTGEDHNEVIVRLIEFLAPGFRAPAWTGGALKTEGPQATTELSVAQIGPSSGAQR